MHLLIQPDFKVGDRQPEDAGYLAWHEWAEVQHKGGLRQKECGRCGLWRYPQDMSDKVEVREAKNSRGVPVLTEAPICLMCEPEATNGTGEAGK